MLGSMDGAEYVGPRAPTLPNTFRSMEPRDFTLKALNTLGVRLTPESNDLYLAEENGGREYIRFEEQATPSMRSTFYNPGTPAFQRLVSRIVATGIHEVEDLDHDPLKNSEEIARGWSKDFGARSRSVEIADVSRAFDGSAVVRVRATVAHDGYERLVDVPCSRGDHCTAMGRSGLEVFTPTRLSNYHYRADDSIGTPQ
jgi:hypothetical protein